MTTDRANDSLLGRITGEAQARSEYVRVARELRRPHHDAEQRYRRSDGQRRGARRGLLSAETGRRRARVS